MAPVEFGNQRHAADLPVRVGERVEEACCRCGLREHRQVRCVSAPARERDRPARQHGGVEQRRWKNARALRTRFAAQVEAEHRIAPGERTCKAGIVVELGPQTSERALESAGKLGVAADDPFERRQPRARVGLGEQDVESHDCGALSREQFVGKGRHPVAPPWPAAHLGEAALVDVDDDDARVQRARHEAAQACVGDREVELGDEAQRQHADGMRAGAEHGGGEQRNAQRAPAGDADQACTNCICVPASSITSPFFRCTVSPVTGLPLTVGCSVPSTCAST